MDPLSAVGVLGGLVVVSVLAGLLWRARDGRLRGRPDDGRPFTSADFDGLVPLESQATLVQFSTEFCSRCPSTERMLRSVAGAHRGVGVAVVDLTTRQDLAARFRVTQTPTVLVLDGHGTERARSGGPPQRAAIEAVIASIAAIDPDTLSPEMNTPAARSSHVRH